MFGAGIDGQARANIPTSLNKGGQILTLRPSGIKPYALLNTKWLFGPQQFGIQSAPGESWSNLT